MNDLDALLIGRPASHAHLMRRGERVPYRAAHDRPPVPDFVAWFDAKKVSSIETSGGLVTKWNDLGPFDLDAENAVVTEQPAYGATTINGIVVPDFNGTDNRLMSPVSWNTLHSSIFVVAESDTVASNRGLVGSGQGNGLALYQNTTSHLTVEKLGIGLAEPMAASITVNQPFAAGVVLDASNIRQYQDGTLETEAHALTPAPVSGGLVIGQYIGFAFWWDGPVGEVIVYNRTLTADEALDTMRYLKSGWGTP